MCGGVLQIPVSLRFFRWAFTSTNPLLCMQAALAMNSSSLLCTDDHRTCGPPPIWSVPWHPHSVVCVTSPPVLDSPCLALAPSVVKRSPAHTHPPAALVGFSTEVLIQQPESSSPLVCRCCGTSPSFVPCPGWQATAAWSVTP